MRMSGVVFCGLVLAATSREAAWQIGTACERLTSVAIPHGRITAVEAIREPLAYCRLAATLTPVADSEIRIEVWMPASGWNGKFQAVGNGAFSGAIATAAMRTALQRGYAVASTDTGHAGGSASFALGHPEKVIDFGWRAVHEMTVAAKRIVSAHYGTAPKHSYWVGCSAGGRQGLKEAQRFPDDYDGIVAGAPGLDWTGRASSAVRVAKALERSEAARLLPADRQTLHKAALDKCDVLDGAKDGIIDDPSKCVFDPSAAGLPPEKTETARLIYSSGLMPGSELGWTDLGWTASARATGLDHFRYIVFRDPAWTIQQFTDADIARAVSEDNGTINALDPNLRPFFDRGGRLIQYHGWSDPQISPLASTRYYAAVVDALGGRSKIESSYRLFMFPGMGHCGGGERPAVPDMLGALERWVEDGKRP